MLALTYLLLAATPSQKLVIGEVHAFDPSLKVESVQVQDRLAVELSKVEGFSVLTSTDLEAMLGLERQRQLLGCNDEATSCAGEIGAAMGASWVVVASLGRAGPKLRLDVKLIAADVNSVAVRLGYDTTADALSSAVETAAAEIAEALRRATGTGEPHAKRTWVAPAVTLGAGVLIAAGGVVLLAMVPSQRSSLQGDVMNLTADVALSRQGALDTQVKVGVALTAVGAAAAVAGVLWWALMPSPRPLAFWVSPTFNGMALGMTW